MGAGVDEKAQALAGQAAGLAPLDGGGGGHRPPHAVAHPRHCRHRIGCLRRSLARDRRATDTSGRLAHTLALGGCGRAHASHWNRHRLACQHVPFPLARPSRLDARRPPCDAHLHHRLLLCRDSRLFELSADGFARALWLAKCARLLVSRDPLPGRGRVRHVVRALSLCLSQRPREFSAAVGLHARGRPHPGPDEPRGILARRPATGAAGTRRRGDDGADGEPQRHRRGRVSRGANPHCARLYHLARAFEPRCCRAAGRAHAGGRFPAADARKGCAQRAALPPHDGALSGHAARTTPWLTSMARQCRLCLAASHRFRIASLCACAERDPLCRRRP